MLTIPERLDVVRVAAARNGFESYTGCREGYPEPLVWLYRPGEHAGEPVLLSDAEEILLAEEYTAAERYTAGAILGGLLTVLAILAVWVIAGLGR